MNPTRSGIAVFGNPSGQNHADFSEFPANSLLNSENWAGDAFA
jgi:hypothetical protein